MREEIFGPVLPILAYDTQDEAIGYVNRHPRPLALYWFGNDDARRDHVLHSTISGGVTVNDTCWHFAQENLPFGGVGASGIGAYHGEHGLSDVLQVESQSSISPRSTPSADSARPTGASSKP